MTGATRLRVERAVLLCLLAAASQRAALGSREGGFSTTDRAPHSQPCSCKPPFSSVSLLCDKHQVFGTTANSMSFQGAFVSTFPSLYPPTSPAAPRPFFSSEVCLTSVAKYQTKVV